MPRSEPPGNQTENEPIPFLSCSNNCPTGIQRSEKHTLNTFNGDTTNLPLTITTPLTEERLVRDEQTNELYLPLTSTNVLERKQETLYVPMDFENNLTVDALVDSRNYVSAIDQEELDTKKRENPNNVLKINDPPIFHTHTANVQLEKPLITAIFKSENENNTFVDFCVVIEKLAEPITRLHFIKNNSSVIDSIHGFIHFPHLTMQVKTGSSEATAKPQLVRTEDALKIPPRTAKTIRAFVHHPSKWNTTCTVTPLEKFTETASLLISPSMSTINDNRVAVRVTHTTKSGYLFKNNTQNAEFSVITPDQPKYIKTVDMTILSMIPEGDPDLTAYSNKLLKTIKPEPQNNIFWFPTPENPDELEIHTPLQTRIL